MKTIEHYRVTFKKKKNENNNNNNSFSFGRTEIKNYYI